MTGKRLFGLAILAVTAALPVAGWLRAGGKEIALGATIPNLTFKDIHYLPRSLDDFGKKKAFVLVFTNTTCPIVQRSLPTLQALEKEYRAKGVQFVAVNVGADDSIIQVAAQAVRFEMEFPFVKDTDFSCAEALGVKRTPEVAVLDGERRLRYRGRIDDQHRLGGSRAAPTQQPLKDALDAILAGKEVPTKETPVDGCPITRPEPKRPARAVTFAEHVAPIFRKHCQGCHRPGTAAPFSLVTYKDATAHANVVAEVVAEGRMPPWFAAPGHGDFVNKRGLTAEERDTVADWVRSGTPLGDESKLPPALPEIAKPSKWAIGTPDLIVEAPRHELPATGDIDYYYAVLPHVFTEDTWLQAVQILPDNPRTVHHCNMVFFNLKEGFKQANFVTGYVPGNGPMNLPDGIAFRMPRGSSPALQIHYVSTGKPEKCRVSVGFKFAKGDVQKRLQHLLLYDTKFAIPPGAPAHRVEHSRTLDCDAEGVALFVHMHLRGRDMSFIAHYPDGKDETLLVVPNYSFDWQMPYRWATGKKCFPKGMRLEAIAHYDNSKFNPFNPDPTATVREGQQTKHEMMNGYFFYTDANEQLNMRVDPKTGHAEKK
ncbi:MAG TPA: redoxin family protein [Gemmataceae bacterium]|nr:redoxin family protein [Gemmataceae bacterium]